MIKYICLFLCSIVSLFSVDYKPSDGKRKTLYKSIDPLSVSAHLAFYRLFPDTAEGKKALDDALRLLSKGQQGKKIEAPAGDFQIPLVGELVEVVNRPPQGAAVQISLEELAWIDSLASHLKNRSLRGFRVLSLEEVHNLPSDEIDLGRALLISQMGDDLDLQVVRSYEAVFDLMALQIMARLPDMKPKTIIAAMNRFIFDEMHFRFPPQSLMVEDADLYTFLPSVVDSRRGVCLGVSILYLCLAQRIGIKLTIITPPGHIFVRYDETGDAINIETTARGIDIPDEHYLSIENRELQRRSMREVVGMAHMNHAATFWHRNEHAKAIETYHRALPYMPNDPLVKEFLAYNYLIAGETEKGSLILKELLAREDSDPLESYRMAEDFLAGKVDVEGLSVIFQTAEKLRSSIEEKRAKIENSLKKYPEFREGWLQLAVIFLQLDRHNEALTAFLRFHALDETDPMVEYYIAALYAERLDFKRAWHHYHLSKNLVEEVNYDPPMLKELKLELVKQYLGDANE